MRLPEKVKKWCGVTFGKRLKKGRAGQDFTAKGLQSTI